MHSRYLFNVSSAIGILFLSVNASAQTSVSGSVMEQKSEKDLSGVAVYIPGTGDATFTDERGRFRLNTSKEAPFNLVFSSLGYGNDTVEIGMTGQKLNIVLNPARVIGDEVVVSASRHPESYLKSPVTVERMSLRDLKRVAGPNYYDAIGKIKGVDMVTASLLFTSPTTRGFTSNFNYNVNQFADGMDNAAPGLNFSVANLAGIPELDIASVELLPGAASALYGAGGTNGTIILMSKDPFQYQGLSAQTKTGIMHVGEANEDASMFQQYAIRYAKAYNNKFAFKVNAEFTKAQDWIADDYRNFNGSGGVRSIKTGDRKTDPAYDGINIYGDENAVNMRDVATAMIGAGAIPAEALNFVPNQNVTRTGYKEKDLVDYNTYNVKLGGMAKYRISRGLTATLQGNWGQGTSVLTGADRYSLKDFMLGQYKLELTGRHFTLRGYTTQENSGNTYNATALGQIINESWKPSTQWYPEFVGAFLQAKQSGAADAQAYQLARVYADNGMPAASSGIFDRLKDSIINSPIPRGAKFADKTDLYHYEGLYDFTHLVKYFDLRAGASFRRYSLNSDGTIFDDKGKRISVDQTGVFAQAAKTLFKEKLKLTAAGRFDQIQNFEARVTPRLAAVYTFVPENNFRVSYQTGYRPPTNQDQYIDLDVSRARLIGGLPQSYEKYNLQAGSTNPGFTLENVMQYGAAFQQEYAKNLKAGMPDNIAQYAAAVAAEKTLTPYVPKKFKPETVRSYEIGYRGIISKKLLVDAYAYKSFHDNFIGGERLIQAKKGAQQIIPQDTVKYFGPQLASELTRTIYVPSVNLDKTVEVFGWGLSADYSLPRKYVLSANVSYNTLSGVPSGFRAYFNSPAYRVNVGLSNDNVFKNAGFNINYRHQAAFLWQGNFGDGDVPAINTLDAQVSYRLPKYKMSFRLGGSNILNYYYRNGVGYPSVGGLYYVALGYNL